MAIKKYKGKTKFIYFPVTASCPMYANSLVRFVSGAVAPVRGPGSPLGAQVERSGIIIGVLKHDIASTDDDYATTRNVEVEVPVENFIEWEVDVIDSVVAADVGLFIDLYDACNFQRGVSTYDHAQVVKRVSANKAIVVLNVGIMGFGEVGAA